MIMVGIGPDYHSQPRLAAGAQSRSIAILRIWNEKRKSRKREKGFVGEFTPL
jgi:hypothetical protein